MNTDPISLSPDEKATLVLRKATCPFIGTAIATGYLPVRNDPKNSLASINDVVKLGNSGGGDLGEVLKVFAKGNHAFMLGDTGKLDQPVPVGQFSLDFPGSQGSHPGHSGILQSNPDVLGSGRFSDAEFDRLAGRAKNGYVKRSDIGKFIAENLTRDPNSKVFGAHVAKLLASDFGRFIGQLGPSLLEKLGNETMGPGKSDEERKLFEALTKTLGEDNLVGSAGEFGLMLAFLANKPGSQKVDGEPAISVADLIAMFKEKKFPDGWETWPKTRRDWVTNTMVLALEAGKEYLKYRA